MGEKCVVDWIFVVLVMAMEVMYDK